MEIPKSLRLLMQKDHEVRVFVSHQQKNVSELTKRIEQLESRVQELSSWIWKPQQQSNKPEEERETRASMIALVIEQ